jgi:hypothetical protein
VTSWITGAKNQSRLASPPELGILLLCQIQPDPTPTGLDGVLERFGFDFADALTTAQWEEICRVFQKRHLLSHRMGVIDDEYLQKANDSGAVPGRKIIEGGAGSLLQSAGLLTIVISGSSSGRASNSKTVACMGS